MTRRPTLCGDSRAACRKVEDGLEPGPGFLGLSLGAERRHLGCARRQVVRISAADLELTFEGGESIWTESSYKWDAEAIIAEGRAAGFREAGQWVDEDAGFVLTRFMV